MGDLSDILANPLIATALGAGIVALIGAILDWRHQHRPDRDRVSLIAWGRLSMAALVVAIACFGMALQTGLRGGQ